MSMTISAGSIAGLATLQKTNATSNTTSSASSVPSSNVAQPTGNRVEISDQAKALSDLLDNASKLVQAGHVEPFTGYDKGQLTTGAVINVKKYNDYLFGKAAETVVSGAAKQGVTLDKDEVVAQLKGANKTIADLDQSQVDRNKALGAGSALTRLSQSDIDKATDMYIAAQENGIPVDITSAMSFKAASTLADPSVKLTVVSTDAYQAKYGNDHSAETVARATKELPNLEAQKTIAKDDPRSALLSLSSSQKDTLSSKYGMDANFLDFLTYQLPRDARTDGVVNMVSALASLGTASSIGQAR